MSERILLINPKHPYVLGTPPLGIGYLLSYSRKNSSNYIAFLDENYQKDPDGKILSLMRTEKISAVGISFPSSAVYRVIEICRLIRASFGSSIRIFAGGYHPTSEPELTLRLIPDLDFVITGEAEKIVAKIDDEWMSLNNVAYLKDGVFHKNSDEFIDAIDDVPHPRRSDFDKKYFLPTFGAISGIYGKVATIMSSRGCPYSCCFCSSKLIQKKVRFHSTHYVLAEIEHILETLGNIDYLYFLDVMFLAKWSRVEELCREMIAQGLHRRFKWAATVAANVVDAEKLKLMKEAGCFYLSFGFESNSENVLKIINKKAAPEDNRRACELCRKFNIYVNSAFLFGIPGETIQDLQKTIDFVKNNTVHFTGVNIMKPLPGSPFYYEFIRNGLISPSIEEWHAISSVNIRGKIYNDAISHDTYEKYIKMFNRTVRNRCLLSSISANAGNRIKYFLGLGKWKRSK